MLSIGRGSTVSVIDSLSPFIIVRRPLVVAGVEHEADRLEAGPRSSMSSASVAAIDGVDRVSRGTPAAAARSKAPVIWRRSGTPAATARATKPGPPSRSRRCAVDARRPGEQRDDRALGASSCWSAASLAARTMCEAIADRHRLGGIGWPGRAPWR